MSRAFIIVIVLFLTSPSSFGFDFFRPKANGMGQTLIVSEMSSVNALSLPSMGFKPRQWEVEAGYNRRFELADLDQLFVAGAYRHRKFTFAGGASQFGKTDLYAEQILKGAVSYQALKWTAGLSLSAMNIEIGNGYGGLRAATFGIGGAYRYLDYIVGLSVDDLTSPQLAPGSERRRPLYDLHTEMIRENSFTIAARLRMQSEQSPRFGLGQTIRLSENGAFFWGISSKPFEFGGGIELSLSAGKFIYSTSVHPVLGFTHTVSLSYGSAKPSLKRKPGFD